MQDVCLDKFSIRVTHCTTDCDLKLRGETGKLVVMAVIHLGTAGVLGQEVALGLGKLEDAGGSHQVGHDSSEGDRTTG